MTETFESFDIKIENDTGKVLIGKEHAKRIKLDIYWDMHGKKVYDDQHPCKIYRDVDFEVYERSYNFEDSDYKFDFLYIKIPSKNIDLMCDGIKEEKNGCWTVDTPWGAG